MADSWEQAYHEMKGGYEVLYEFILEKCKHCFEDYSVTDNKCPDYSCPLGIIVFGMEEEAF